MAFLIAAGAVGFLLCGLLSNIRLLHSLTLEREHATVELKVRCFFGLVRFRLGGRLTFFPLHLYVGKKGTPLGARQRKKQKSLLSRELLLQRRLWFRAEELRVRGAVGSEEDALWAIRWAGVLSILLDGLLRAFLEPKNLWVRVTPVCGARCFCLNLEGIVTLRPWQIIGVAIRHQIRGTRGKKLWRTPSKTS